MIPYAWLHFFSRLRILALAAFISGCSTLPAFGPSSDAILGAADIGTTPSVVATNFQLIDVSKATLPVHLEEGPLHFSPRFMTQKLLSANQQVIPGDVIVIHVWETADDGLFATQGRRKTAFTLSVSNSGNIDVPYAGSIQVVNRSVHQIRDILLERYRGKAIEPEINVEIKETTSRGVSVLGAVAAPGRINIPAQGMRLLDLLASAGGIPSAAWESTLTITRHGTVARLGFDRILADVNNNIVVLPGDTIQVTYLPRKFSVYGAITKPGNITINTPTPRLSDLLAESGGLNGMQAEASSVFIFRPALNNLERPNNVPKVYRLNLSKPDAFLLASAFKVSKTDIVYVATADASEFRKFVTTLLSPFLGGANNIQSIGN